MIKKAILMAGGLGLKFWPRSRESNPKQFLHLGGDGTMIQNTYNRLLEYFKKEDIYIVTTRQLYDNAKEQLNEIDDNNFIIEPFGRNTAPALALAAMHMRKNFGDDVIMYAFPSDQIISNLVEFNQSLDLAGKAAVDLEGIVTIGVKPTRPETQFGYVQIKEEENGLGDFYEQGLRLSTTFAEKPDEGTAKRFLKSGDFLWNSGIFVLTSNTFRNAYGKYLTDLFGHFNLLSQYESKSDYQVELERIYKQINPLSFDYGILEKTNNVYVVKSEFSWSDLGTWDELFRMTMKDARNNVIEGDVLALHTTNSLISSNGKFIGVIGMNDVVVIDSEDAILICNRGETQKVRELVDFMRRKNIGKYL